VQMGIVGAVAPELCGARWIDVHGHSRDPLTLVELGDSFKILYFFQHWCPGCHEHGFPALQKLTSMLAAHGVGFAVVQTVFEGNNVNTYARLRETQQRYDLRVPFGHAAAGKGEAEPVIMTNFLAGGTPWFVVIAPNGRVVLNAFGINPDRLGATLLQALGVRQAPLAT
jgi:thiol-disulfide isomerase/thioredoxin